MDDLVRPRSGTSTIVMDSSMGSCGRTIWLSTQCCVMSLDVSVTVQKWDGLSTHPI